MREIKELCSRPTPVIRLLLAAFFLLVFALPAKAEITAVGSTVDANTAKSTSVTLNTPAGAIAGDVFVAQITVRDSATITPPSGWTLIRSNLQGDLRQSLYYWVAAAPISASYTWSLGASVRSAGGLAVYRGVENTTPIDAHSGQGGSGTSITAPSITTTVNYALLVAFFGAANGNTDITIPTGMSLVFTRADKAGNAGATIAAASQLQTSAGASGTRTATGPNANNIGQLIALRPARTFRIEAAGGGNIGTQIAGTSFNIRITALKPDNTTDTTFTGTVQISSTGNLSAGSGTTAAFTAGVLASHTVRISNTGTFNITAIETSATNRGVSNDFLVVPKLQILVPGETAAPGTASGKTGTPLTQTPGTAFDVTVNAVDEFWNLVTTATDTITLTSSDAAAVLPAAAALVNGTRVFSVTLNTPPSQTVTANASSPTRSDTSSVIPLAAALGGFNAYETSTPAGAITGVIKTKTAGASFNLDLIALNAAKTAILTTFTGTVKVELLDSSSGGTLDANGCNAGWPVIQTLATNPVFVAADNGRKSVSFQENNAWHNVRVRISYPATGTATAIGCSGDNFAIRPGTLGAYAAHTDWETAGTTVTLNNAAASGTPIHKAGRNFTLVATGYNAASVVTSNYNGTPTAVSVAAVAPATVTGNFAVGTFIAPSPATGTVRSDTATYSEVGPVSLILQDQSFASVDAADTDGDCTATGRYVCSEAFNVGRFVPDHFIVTTGTLTNRRLLGCSPASAFTYAGEQLRVGFTLTARNGLATPAVTQNYTTASGLAKLDGTVIANFGFGAIDLADATPPTNATALTGNLGLVASSGSWTDGAGSFTADLGLNRAATPDGPYESFRLGVVPADTDGVTVRTSDLNLDTTVPADSNDRVLAGSSIVRFGRLRLSNAHGSELLDLPIPISIQYWNGTLFTTHTADSCTSLSSSNIGLDNYKNNLASGETSVNPATISFVSGVGTMRLTAPGIGNSGSVDVCVDLGPDPAGGVTCSATASAGKSYLQGKWAPGTAWDNDPKVRATFGVYKNANEFIYLREMY